MDDAEVDLGQLAAQFDTLMAGAPLGIGIFDRDCRHVRVNALLAEMNGRPAQELLGRTPGDVNGEVGLQAEGLYRQVMADGVPMRGVRLTGEVTARPGDVRHWDLTFYPVRREAPSVGSADGDPGAVLGLCVIVDDVTVEAELAAQLERTSARVAQITESMAVGYLAMDGDWRITYVNDQAVATLGLPREELVGGVIWQLFPQTAGTAFEAGYRRAKDGGVPVTFDAYYPPPLDAWYEVRATPEGDGVALYFTDITLRVSAQRDAEAATRRAELLAAVSQSLSGLTDVDEALAVLPGLLVPEIGDWAIVTSVDGAAAGLATPAAPVMPRQRAARAAAGLRRLRDVAFAHADPDRRGWLAQYALSRMDAYRSMPADAVSPFIARALLDGAPSVIPHDAAAAVLSTLPDDPGNPAVEAIRALSPASAVAVPLVSRGHTVGMLSLCWDHADDRRAEPPAASPSEELGADPVSTRTALGADGPTPEVLALVQAVAERVAGAVESIAAAQRQRVIAEELQRSLLTDPPEPDHAHVVVRYVPAAAAAQVGGDWYDAFLQPPGSTVLVIGDVVGHDITAAAAMGQVRTLVRAAAVMTGAGPAQVLASTDAAMQALAVSTTATAVVMRLEQDEEQVARGVTTLRWSNAGHPPPIVMHPDGSVTGLGPTQDDGDGDSDLLLGVDPGCVRREHTVEVARGSTVLLYTDGLVERRGEHLETGLRRLVEVLADAAAEQRADGPGPSADSFWDAVLRRMLPERPTDDVALVAVHLHPQDRPRPAVAGERRTPSWAPDEPQVLPRAP